ncbi:hypothetical protein VP01_26g2 [Puccinia sorghi]|uniref:Uncharacterized protein n=1 Tax=Puccinia sorghi TaxID=27349 RepID=A0A0L6V5G5_9BASI|nr:hypothetical protein VP01_26g2 [Puccinia sorghi]
MHTLPHPHCSPEDFPPSDNEHIGNRCYRLNIWTGKKSAGVFGTVPCVNQLMSESILITKKNKETSHRNSSTASVKQVTWDPNNSSQCSMADTSTAWILDHKIFSQNYWGFLVMKPSLEWFAYLDFLSNLLSLDNTQVHIEIYNPNFSTLENNLFYCQEASPDDIMHLYIIPWKNLRLGGVFIDYQVIVLCHKTSPPRRGKFVALFSSSPNTLDGKCQTISTVFLIKFIPLICQEFLLYLNFHAFKGHHVILPKHHLFPHSLRSHDQKIPFMLKRIFSFFSGINLAPIITTFWNYNSEKEKPQTVGNCFFLGDNMGKQLVNKLRILGCLGKKFHCYGSINIGFIISGIASQKILTLPKEPCVRGTLEFTSVIPSQPVFPFFQPSLPTMTEANWVHLKYILGSQLDGLDRMIQNVGITFRFDNPNPPLFIEMMVFPMQPKVKIQTL